MPNFHTHVPRDTDDKPTYYCRSIHKKQVCRVCGWVREYSMPVDSNSQWIYGEWQPSERTEKPAGPDAGDRR